MELNEIIGILDDSILSREVVDLKQYDGNAISYANRTSENLSAIVNDIEYTDLIKICFVPKGDIVKVFINNVARFKLENIDLEDVLTFSIS